MKEFNRGVVRARIQPDGSVRIEGLRIGIISGQPGINIHPNTAKYLAEWIIEATAKGAVP